MSGDRPGGQLATTLLTIEEIDLLAQGLAALVGTRPDATDDASRCSWLVHNAPMGARPEVRSLATHLAELRYELERYDGEPR